MADDLETVEPTVRYKKPKILTVDLPWSLAKRLRAAGYNVLPDTFGRPFKVERGDGFLPVVVKASVPNYSEQEVIIIDLTPPSPAEGPESEKAAPPGELDWFAKTSEGVIGRRSWPRSPGARGRGAARGAPRGPGTAVERDNLLAQSTTNTTAGLKQT
jgi:hypothetical protein